jgi:hypothetical protein
MSPRSQKKADELRWFLMFQRDSDVCPGSEPLQPREPAPDIILPPHELGIELIEYVLGPSANGSHMRRLETVRREIVHQAQISYESHACRCVQVTVIWGNVDCPTKNEQKKLAAAISQVVPSFDWNKRRVLRIHWEQFTASILQKYVAEISAYLVTDRGKGCWSSAASIWAGDATQRLQSTLDYKENKVAQYRVFCREVWLLIVANKEWLASMYFKAPAASVEVFRSSFDRAFLLDERTGAVSELILHA